MKPRFKGCLGGCLLFAVGCVPSLHPLCEEQDAARVAGLAGVWQGREQQTLVFSERGADGYRVVHLEANGGHGHFAVRATRLGGTLFLDASPAEADVGGHGLYKLHWIPAHTFLRVALRGDTLELAPLSVRWLTERLKENPELLRHEWADGRLVLTASTAELRKFLLDRQTEAGVFDEPSRWTRVAEPPADGHGAPAP